MNRLRGRDENIVNLVLDVLVSKLPHDEESKIAGHEVQPLEAIRFTGADHLYYVVRVGWRLSSGVDLTQRWLDRQNRSLVHKEALRIHDTCEG